MSTSQLQPVIIEYILQNDDNEMNSKKNPYPNIYILPKKYSSVGQVTVREVIEAFPLSVNDPNSTYLIRFETAMPIATTKKVITVWQDLDGQLDQPVPKNNGKIRVKALRLPKGIKSKVVPKQPQQRPEKVQQVQKQVSAKQQEQTKPQNPFTEGQQQPQSSGSGGLGFGMMPDLSSMFEKVGGLIYGSQAQTQQKVENIQPKVAQKIQQPSKEVLTNLFGEGYQNYKPEDPEVEDHQRWDSFEEQKDDLLFTDTSTSNNHKSQPQPTFAYQETAPSHETPKVPSQKSFSIFDDDEDLPQQSPSVSQPAGNNNLFGNDLFMGVDFSAPTTPATPSQAAAAGQPQNPTQGRGGEMKASRIDDVKDLYNGQALLQENWDKAYQKYEVKIATWNGRPPMKNHIRVLLCTLDQVLWENHGWERVGMDKLSDPTQVKKYYRKATMLCHPDKIGTGGDNPDKVYIANRCFAAITEAYNTFKKEEGIQ